MRIDLSGQIALVTGASRGIGRAIALALGEAGATVAVHYHRQEERAREVAEAARHGARTFAADLGDPGACRGLLAQVTGSLGGLDLLVNNAGVAIEAPLSQDPDTWEASWQRTLAVNLQAPAILCREALAPFQARGGGRIVNVASRAAFRGDTPDYLAYAASKGGLVALTRSLARGLGRAGVKAFLLAPGYTRTDMAQPFIDRYGEKATLSDIALPRVTEPEDIAPAVVFLASGLADHATGCTLDLNAGSYVH